MSNFDPFVAEWVMFSKDPKYNLVEKCLKLAQILEYPNLDIESNIQKINEIAKQVKGEGLKIKLEGLQDAIDAYNTMVK